MHLYIPKTKWTWAFICLSVFQASVAIALEAYVFGEFHVSLAHYDKLRSGDDKRSYPETRAIPTYMALLFFAFSYQIWLVYDALARKNTIQVIGICIYNIGILAYTGIQIDQIKDAVLTLSAAGRISPHFWSAVSAPLIAVCVLLGLCTILFFFVAFKLYDEFSWNIFREISADLRMKRRLLMYHIYIALLKFDFFFFIGFTVQFLVVVVNTTDVEFILTVVAMPIMLAILFLTAYCVCHENTLGMVFTMFVWLISLAYFLFKLVRMYAAPDNRIADYLPVRRSLTTFAVLTIILLIITIVVAFICTMNFHKGLKDHLIRPKPLSDTEGLVSDYNLPTHKTSQGHERMTMD